MKVRKAVIPAAGLGTRMLPVTKTVPKEMLPMVDRPVMQYIVEEAVSAGIEDILIITNRGKDVMEDYFDYAPELEDKLRRAGKDDLIELVHKPANLANIFFVRQKQTLGLGHAIYQAFSGGKIFQLCHFGPLCSDARNLRYSGNPGPRLRRGDPTDRRP